MEEPAPAPAQAKPTPPPSAPQNLPPQPPTSLPQKSKKRPLDSNISIQNSKYFKMRAVVKDLRPHIIEVLRSPDFRNCKAADEIRKNLKVLMDLYKQMTAETVSMGKCKIVPEVHSTSNENKEGDAKPGPEDGWAHGTYVVGGSAFGWNFITFPGGKATYYGVTKGTFRATAQ